jgi:FtsP/CotA-like multicopper oxidase with cupredoxin domain
MMPMAHGGPEYAAFLVNGRPPADPAVFEVTRGERVRLRLLNLGSATTFRIAIAGHPMTVTHTDGRPVRPVQVDALLIGMGERYDVVVHANHPGIWTVAAASVEGGTASARAVLRYTGTTRATPADGEVPSGLRGGRLLSLADLVSIEAAGTPERAPDRTFDLTLSGGMMSSAWIINGQAYPDAEPFAIREGERVRVRMTNMSMAIHPMHLHGHFFRVGEALKDTVLVPPHMGRVTFEFCADNPGDWFFHCHNLYHMESGMARVFRYA